MSEITHNKRMWLRLYDLWLEQLQNLYDDRMIDTYFSPMIVHFYPLIALAKKFFMQDWRTSTIDTLLGVSILHT